jgi:23S rRNA (adenine-N6)-dimethyltransferase
VIVQWELAAKDAALWPATLRSTYWRAWFNVAIVRRLSRAAFAPVPSVDAAVLRLTRRERPLVAPSERAGYWSFLNAAFRSQGSLSRSLRPVLSGVELRRLAAVLGFSPDARPRDLDATQWAGVYGHAARAKTAVRRGAKYRGQETRTRERT